MGIDEVAVGGTELSVSSGVVTDNVILTAAKACTVSIYSVQGKLSASITLSLATMLSALPICQQVSISSVQVQQLVR